MLHWLPFSELGATVQIKCFGCDAVMEVRDSDGAVDAFLAHARERHQWSYPIEALRTYARNYAEATERLTGSTDRLTEIGAVAVHPVTDARIDDWLQLFDHDGFADNPDWASCYCIEPHVPASPDQPERPWRDNRAALTSRLRCGSTYGYLAYVDAQVAGWVNASFRSDYGLYRLVGVGGPEASSVIGVSCFVIAPPFRRHGIAATLLDRVIADAAGRGAAWIEGYPYHDPKPGDAGHFRGPRSMYSARGFEAVEERDKFTVMRRRA